MKNLSGEQLIRQHLLAFLISVLVACLGLVIVLHLYRMGKTDAPILSAKESKEIVFVTYSGPTTYNEDSVGDTSGFEHDMAQLFAESLEMKVRFEVLPTEISIINTLEKRQGHIAAGLAITPRYEQRIRFGTAYMSIAQQVLYSVKSTKPHNVKDLVGKRIGVVAHSRHAEKMAALSQQIDNLQWEEFENENTDDLLDRLQEGTLDIVIADSNWVELSRNAYPNIDIAFNLNDPVPLAWAFPLAGDDFLYQAAKKFFVRIQQDGTLKRLINRSLTSTRKLDKQDMEAFLEKVQTVLPKYKNFFYEAQEITGIDWRLLAALAYQESHWDPLATSPTNVRGMMMLTEDTADRLKVKNRLDARDSIIAGAKYLLLLKDTISDRVTEEDKMWFALAAYNQGMGHLEDARVLTQRLKRNPNTWHDLKAVMPLLSDPLHHQGLKYGYARGGEAVIMTETIRTYFDVLGRIEKPYVPSITLGSNKDINFGLKAKPADKQTTK